MTGGGRGIGRDIAIAFASESALVVIADISESEGHQAVKTIEQDGGSAL